MRSTARRSVAALVALAWALLALSPPPIPDDADGLATVLSTSELALRSADTPADQIPDIGHRQQRVYRQLATDPALAEAVLQRLPEKVRQVAQLNVSATRDIMGTVGKKRTHMPAWRIVPAAPADALQRTYTAAEAEFGVPWEILAAVHLVETRMGRLRGVSSAGARGPMQFIPETWARFGEGDIESNTDAIRAAARHLKAHGAPGRMDKALWHYNQSDRYVRAVRGYAAVIEADPLAWRGYYHWQVYYRTVRGILWMPEGYAETAPVPVDQWCARADTPCP